MFQLQSASKNILTVSKLNRLARSVLETEIGQIWLSAEISNFVAASSGHWYFTLKDERAQVKAAMFKGANRRVTNKPKEGNKVLVKANIGLYEPRGDYQLIVEHIEPEGQGLLKQEFDALKQKLMIEGLFSQSHKKPITKSVENVGVITSATGAALHDILTVLKRRNPAIRVVIYPTQVQGDMAADLISHAINLANTRQEVDVLIVGRGGGSLEDLWCFNQEQVARSIFSSTIPIVSAVGHEVDISIADFAADMRAPTPSAAAELVSQDQHSLYERSANLQNQLFKSFNSLLQMQRHRQETLNQRLLQNHPKTRLEQKTQYLDQLQYSLESQAKQKIRQAKQRLQHLQTRLLICSPKQSLRRQQQKWQDTYSSLIKNIHILMESKKHYLANNLHLLDTVSPLATLARGYSISFKQNEIVKSVQRLQVGDTLTTRLVDGNVQSQVTKIDKQQ